MHNPDNALMLYVVLLVVAFMFSPRFAKVRAAITSAGNTAKAKTNG